MQQLKVGIIGAGCIARLHAAAYRKLGVTIAAVADVKRAVYEQHKDLFGSATFYENYDDLLRDPVVDVADVCLINRYHLEAVRKAVAARKHIFCEKTLTDGADSSAELVKLLRGYDKTFQVGYMKRFFPATRKALELLPALGPLVSVYVRSYQGFEWGDCDPHDQAAWKPKDGKESFIHWFASGMLNMAGSHMLDLMRLLAGEPQSVYALNWKPAAYDAETNSHALFRMKSGAVTHFEAALSPYSRGGLRQDGWDEKIEINGTRGRLEVFYVIWDKPANNAPLVRFYSEREKTATDFTFPKVDAFQDELAYFMDCCANGRRAVPSVEDGYEVDRIIAACYRSARTGEIVAL